MPAAAATKQGMPVEMNSKQRGRCLDRPDRQNQKWLTNIFPHLIQRAGLEADSPGLLNEVIPHGRQ